MIEKINGFWVPSNDVHIDDWKKDKNFTQNKCLEKLIMQCKSKDIKFNHVLDIGAWVGTWTMAMNGFCGRVIDFEPDPVHYECLGKNCPEYVEKHQLAGGNEEKMISRKGEDVQQFFWSPDSQKISYKRKNSSGQHDVSLYDVSKNSITEVTSNLDVEQLGNWSPDGEWITYSIIKTSLD